MQQKVRSRLEKKLTCSEDLLKSNGVTIRCKKTACWESRELSTQRAVFVPVSLLEIAILVKPALFLMNAPTAQHNPAQLGSGFDGVKMLALFANVLPVGMVAGGTFHRLLGMTKRRQVSFQVLPPSSTFFLSAKLGPMKPRGWWLLFLQRRQIRCRSGSCDTKECSGPGPRQRTSFATRFGMAYHPGKCNFSHGNF
jgi:hypothetical protein